MSHLFKFHWWSFLIRNLSSIRFTISVVFRSYTASSQRHNFLDSLSISIKVNKHNKHEQLVHRRNFSYFVNFSVVFRRSKNVTEISKLLCSPSFSPLATLIHCVHVEFYLVVILVRCSSNISVIAMLDYIDVVGAYLVFHPYLLLQFHRNVWLDKNCSILYAKPRGLNWTEPELWIVEWCSHMESDRLIVKYSKDFKFCNLFVVMLLSLTQTGPTYGLAILREIGNSFNAS